MHELFNSLTSKQPRISYTGKGQYSCTDVISDGIIISQLKVALANSVVVDWIIGNRW